MSLSNSSIVIIYYSFLSLFPPGNWGRFGLEDFGPQARCSSALVQKRNCCSNLPFHKRLIPLTPTTWIYGISALLPTSTWVSRWCGIWSQVFLSAFAPSRYHFFRRELNT